MPPTWIPANTTSRAALAFSLLAVLVVVGARLWYSADAQSVALSSQVISVVSFVHGMALFVVLGRHRATMAGLFMAGSAAIVGLSGLLLIPDPSSFMEGLAPGRYLNAALFGSTLAQIGIGMVCLHRDSVAAPECMILPDRVVQRAQVLGLVMLGGTIALGGRLGSFEDGFGFAAVLLLCVPALLSRRGLFSPGNIALILGSLAAFPTLVISGTGRLRAIALLLAVLYVFFLRYGRRWMKLLGVVLAPALLAALGAWRRSYEVQISGQAGNETGLSSMFVGIGNFGNLIDVTGHGFTPKLGMALLSPLRGVLPDSMLPAWIPEAIGYEAVAITDPELFATGFSTVVTIYGDMWWNFGVLGLVLAVPVMGFLLELVDRWALRSYQRAGQGERPLLVLVFFSALLGGVGDIVWAGFHTWIVRMYARTAGVLVMIGVTYFIPERASSAFVSFRQVDRRARSRRRVVA